MSPRRRGWSDVTVTDQFCGAGGSSIGARLLGLRVLLGLNHWPRAIETYSTNNPDTAVDCTDISASDPRRYPSTDILITSPECTTHSPAGGNRKRTRPQRDLFHAPLDDDAVTRSRATMWDVLRFAEYHEYRRIIVENVVEAYTQWPLFATWLQAMDVLGYRHKIVSANSMFSWPTPQSRDRIYVHFWRKKDKAPDLEFTKQAPCPKCEKVVEARQQWKNGRTVGKYGARNQYIYVCPRCHTPVTPFYFAALNAIDFSIPAERIGDRDRPLKQRTRDRIAFGLEKYGRRTLVVNLKQGERDSSRAWPADTRPLGSIPTWTDYFAVVETLHTDSDSRRTRGVDEPLPAQSTRQSLGLAGQFLVKLRGTEKSHIAGSASGMDEPMSTLVASGFSAALVGQFAPFLAMRRVGNTVKGIEDPMPTVTTGESQHLLIQGAAFMSMRDTNAMFVGDFAEALRTQGAGMQSALISLAPFIQSFYGTSNAYPLDGAGPTFPAAEVHGLVAAGNRKLNVDDCFFRMLQPAEIGRGMAFPDTYVVTGNKSEQVKQYGNAVTPPEMENQLAREVMALTGERVA
jgi:DNA (cytosine-5)-methyltransferase 1